MAKAPQAAQAQPQGPNVVPLNPTVTPLAANWPDATDATDLLAIVQAQAEAITDNALLIGRYQGVLNAAQAAAGTALMTGIGTASGTPATTLAVTNVAGGSIVAGAAVIGAGVAAGTIILAQQSGTPGGAGSYTLSQAATASAAPLAFQAPAASGIATGTGTGTSFSLAVTAVNGTIVTNATISGIGVPVGTTILNQMSGAAGGAGTYTTSQPTTAASAPLAFAPPAAEAASPWPVPRDAITLNTLSQNQTAVLRTQSALLQHYQDVLNTSQTPIS
jgi:hypothetical protein